MPSLECDVYCWVEQATGPDEKYGTLRKSGTHTAFLVLAVEGLQLEFHQREYTNTPGVDRISDFVSSAPHRAQFWPFSTENTFLRLDTSITLRFGTLR